MKKLKAADLRIGNLVKYKNTESIAIVSLINGKEHFDCRDEFGSFTPNACYLPIPITKEWLEKLGFIKSGDWVYYLPIPLLSMEIHAVLFRNQYLIELSNENKNIVTEVLLVHQLQNLYQSLTGAELKVKP